MLTAVSRPLRESTQERPPVKAAVHKQRQAVHNPAWSALSMRAARSLGGQQTSAANGIVQAKPIAADTAAVGEQEEFDSPHFETAAAQLAAMWLLNLFHMEAIAASDGPSWTEEEIGRLRGALSEIAPAHLAVLNGLIVFKTVTSTDLKGSFHCQSAGPAGAMEIVQSAFDLDEVDFRIAVLHEVGHGVECQHPGTGVRFGRFARQEQLAGEDLVRRISGPVFGDYVWGDVQAGGSEEYFAAAYAVWRVEPGRLPDGMRDWFENRFPIPETQGAAP